MNKTELIEKSDLISRTISLIAKGNIYNLTYTQISHILNNNLNASYLLSFDEWNSKGARIFRGSKAIRLPDHHLVFDVSQTNYRQMNDEQFPDLNYNNEESSNLDLFISSYVNPGIEAGSDYIKAIKAVMEARFSNAQFDPAAELDNIQSFDMEQFIELNKTVFNALRYAYIDMRSSDLGNDGITTLNDVADYILESGMEGEYYDNYTNDTDNEEETRLPERVSAGEISDDERQWYSDAAFSTDRTDVSGYVAESGGLDENGLQQISREETPRTSVDGNGESERAVHEQSEGDSPGGNAVPQDLNNQSDESSQDTAFSFEQLSLFDSLQSIADAERDQIIRQNAIDDIEQSAEIAYKESPERLKTETFVIGSDYIRDLQNNVSRKPIQEMTFDELNSDEKEAVYNDDSLYLTVYNNTVDKMYEVTDKMKDFFAKYPYASQDGINNPDDIKVLAKFFNPAGAGTWIATEFDGYDDNGDPIFYGCATLGYEWEWGYLPTFSEMKSIDLGATTGHLRIERDKNVFLGQDLYFTLWQSGQTKAIVDLGFSTEYEKSIDQELDDYFAKRGSNIENSRFRTYQFFTKDGISKKEKADFLKQEYGTGGSSGPKSFTSRIHSVDFNSKGIFFRLYKDRISNDQDEYSLKWPQVADRIQKLIDDKKYFSESDMVSYDKWLEEKNAKAVSTYPAEETEATLQYRLAERITDVLNNADTRYKGTFSVYRLNLSSWDHIPSKKRNLTIGIKSSLATGYDYNSFTQFNNDKADEEMLNKVLSEDPFVSQLLNDKDFQITFTPNAIIVYYHNFDDKQIDFGIGSDIPVYSKKDAEAFEGVFDVATAQESANLLNREIVDEQGNIYAPQENDDDQLSYTNIYTCWDENDGFDAEFDTLEEAKEYVKTHDYISEIRREHTWMDGNGNMGADDVTTVWSHGFNINVASIVLSDSISGESRTIEKENDVIINDQWKKEHLRSAVLDLTGGNNESSDLVVKPYVKPVNYHIDNEQIGVGTPLERFNSNIEAITLLRKLESEDRNATADEQDILARYVGWGGLSDFFDESKRPEQYKQLKELLNDSEYASARESTLSAFYTQPVVIDAIYKALDKFGFRKGNILEPSCGIGNFFGRLPESMSESSLYGVELDSISSRIAKKLYPNANIQSRGYETTAFDDNFFDVAIGNVPFGDFSVMDKRYDKYNFRIHDYFFAKTIDKVKAGGVIAMITSKGTMDKMNSKVREYIDKRCDLIGAIRLPIEAFKSAAGTETVSDIIFLAKRESPKVHVSEWVNSSDQNFMMIDYFDRYMSRTDIENEVISLLIEGKYDEYNKLYRHCNEIYRKTGNWFGINEIRDPSTYYPYHDVNRESVKERWASTWTNRYGNIKSTSTYRTYGTEIIELYKWFKEEPETVCQYVAVSGKFNSKAKTNEEKYDMAYEYLTLSEDAIENRFRDLYVNGIVDTLCDYVSYLDQKQGQYKQSLNTYFSDHRNMIIGTPSIETSRFGYDLSVSMDNPDELGIELDQRIDDLSYEYVESEPQTEKKKAEVKVVPANMNIKNYSYGIVNNEIYYRTNSTMEQVPSDSSSFDLLKDLIVLNNTYKDLIQSQLNGFSDEVIEDKQAGLSKEYDSFVEKHGRIFKLAKAIKPFIDNDASLARAESLEVYDVDKKEFIRKADIFTERTIHSQEETIEHCDTSFDALLVSLRTRLGVDLDLISKLTDKPVNEVISDLKGSIYRNHLDENEYVSADEYLSGNVRQKFREVNELYNTTLRSFERTDDAVAKRNLQEKLDWLLDNKKALEDALPVDLQPYEIDMPLGASWIPVSIIQKFAEDVILDGNFYRWNRPEIKRSEISKNWFIENKTRIYDSSNLTERFGLPDRGHNALDILESCLNLKREEVAYYVEDENGKKVKVVDKKKTLIAIQKQDLIRREFSNWLKENDDISKELADIYNDRFNCIVDRKYNPDLINPVGLSNLINGKPIELYTHQKEAIAKALFGGNTGVFHSVGAGKTLTLITIAMESKRLGLCNKSLFVVPKAITGQWGRDFINAYPNANVLVADEKSFTKDNRRRFISKIASGNYDAIIISNEQFKQLKLSDERVVSYIQEDIDHIQEFLEEQRYKSGKKDWSVKQAESIKKKLEDRIKKRNEMKKDDFIDFEELGIDKLFIDESHNFKNLAFETSLGRIKGIGSSADAQKSNDLYYKTRYLNQLTNNKGIVFATGTPISNYLAEMFTIQRYLQPDTLRYMDVDNFDSWVSVFGEIVEEQQLDVTGTKYTPRAVLKRYHNLPELMAAFRQVADIRTKDTLDLDLPDVQRINVEVKRTDEQKAYLDELNERLDRIRNNEVDPTEDNMLLITNDGRKMALDQRLVGMQIAEDEKVKADYVSDNVYEEYIRSNDIKGTQAIFSDLSTPDDSKWNIYQQIKDNLVAKGIPEAEIAFIHDYEKQKDKEKLFKMINEGTVRIILGSTSKLGTGVNMQERMVALHHIDVPWKPSDIEQREGRAVRQGNSNDEVKIYRYITADTFDAYSWQIIENKATFISQIMTNRNPARSCDDLDDDGVVLDAAQIKAIATGNPLIKERMTLENDIKKLTISKQEYLKGQARLKENITITIPQDISYRKDNIARLENDIALYKKPEMVLTEDGKEQYALDIEVNGQRFTDYKLAGEELQKMAKIIRYPDDRLSLTYKGKVIGKYQNFEIRVAAGDFLGEARYVIGDKWMSVVNKYESPTNMTKYLIAKLDELPDSLEYQKEALRQAETNLENSRKLLDKPFEFDDELKQKQIRLDQIIESMDHDADFSSDESLEGKTLYDEKGNVITNNDIANETEEDENELEGKEL